MLEMNSGGVLDRNYVIDMPGKFCFVSNLILIFADPLWL